MEDGLQKDIHHEPGGEGEGAGGEGEEVEGRKGAQRTGKPVKTTLLRWGLPILHAKEKCTFCTFWLNGDGI